MLVIIVLRQFGRLVYYCANTYLMMESRKTRNTYFARYGIGGILSNDMKWSFRLKMYVANVQVFKKRRLNFRSEERKKVVRELFDSTRLHYKWLVGDKRRDPML